jgi:vitamin B12 transporter
MDGIRLSDPSGPQVATQSEHLLSSGISKVEILRGPQGLSYGADAGGIINVESNDLEFGNNFIIGSQIGSRGTSQNGISLSTNRKRTSFSFNATDLQSDGFNARFSDSAEPDDDGYKNRSYHARATAKVTDELEFKLVHRDASGETEYDNCYDSSFLVINNCLAIYNFSATRAELQYESNASTHSVSYTSTKTDRDSLSLGVSSFASEGGLDRWEYLGTNSSLENFDFIFGVDLEQEKNGNNSRDNKGYYLDVLRDFSNDIFISGGIRVDDNQDFGEHLSYRLAATYLLNLGQGTLKLKGNLGTGFRAPSLYEIGYNNSPSAYPPAFGLALDAEETDGYEFGMEFFYLDKLRLEAIRFNQKIENAIFYDMASYSGYLQDIGTSRSKGTEINGELELSESVRVIANLTHNKTRRSNGMQRVRRPKVLANIGVTYGKNSLSLNAFYRVSRDSIDESFGSPRPLALDDFGVLDLSARYTFSENIQIFARVENALDKNYRELLDYRSPSRGAFIGAEINL